MQERQEAPGTGTGERLVSYHATKSLASLADPALVDRAADRITHDTGSAMVANMKERTPVAKAPGGGLSVEDWLRGRSGRRPGTARESWRETPVERLGDDRRRVSAESRDKVVEFLNDGTPPHTIRARNAGALAFPSATHANTEDGMVVVNRVQHPGTPPLAIVDRGLAATAADFERIGREGVERWARDQEGG